MDKIFHIEMTRQAMQAHFSERALKTLIAGNLSQDRLNGLLWHPEYHFDEQITLGENHLQELRMMSLQALKQEKTELAWWAFGRLLHTAQDFYAHTNYVTLWVAHHKIPSAASVEGFTLPPPESIEPLSPNLSIDEILAMPGLVAWHVHYGWEVLNMIPGLSGWVRRNAPLNSHARMNLDKPACGPLFDYARIAGAKRTGAEFEVMRGRIRETLGDTSLARFVDHLEQ
jgi:hypothetical protein